jgi:primosomal protein N' (replication factor Y)
MPDRPLPPVGARVLVPLGRRMVVGVVVAHAGGSKVPSSKLRRIEEVVDSTPVFPAELFALCGRVSRYYHHPLGEVLATAMPAWLRKGRAAVAQRLWQWQMTELGRSVDPATLGRAIRQQQALQALADGPLPEPELLRLVNRKVVANLADRNWIVRSPLVRRDDGDLQAPPVLGSSQHQAVETVSAEIDRFHPWLLDGVTGSGKTEVYLALIRKVIDAGRQALVIVPEIGLTPQLMSRFRRRLGDCIGVLHSGMADGERMALWLAAREGEVKVVLGTRSAVFAPLARPGLVVVDEEHDPSLKQADGLRYSARDVAVMRAQRAGVPVILGSATPSLESLHNVHCKRYGLLRLPNRAGGASPPTLRLVDLRGQTGAGGLSNQLATAMDTHLDLGQQVLLFLNRRGFSPVLMCNACGWFGECPRCDARMTLHRSERQLRCHHCDRRQPVPGRCPECQSDRLDPVGLGTERLEQEVHERFPGIEVLRLDRDTVRRRDAWPRVLARLATGEPCILMGTQMLAKGHDYPNITLVGVVNLDQALFSSDFRAAERAAQMLVQVAGRAGRAEKPGTVMVQTHHPDHPLFSELLPGGYRRFAEDLLIERAAAAYPPIGHMVILRAEATRNDAVREFLQQAVDQADRVKGVHLLGPLPAPMERRAGRYRMQVIIMSRSRKTLHALLDSWVARLYRLRSGARVRWSLDVDPCDTF